jgi:hypothetical protein
MYLRFARGLKSFLREPITGAMSLEIMRQRLDNRSRNLLQAVRTGIYDNPGSPYLKLLRFAGCEYGDLEAMVNSDGVEPTLRKLQIAGVYVTLEEFKGRREITRGGKSFNVREADFDRPLRDAVLADKSGGTRSGGTRTAFDFDALSNYAVHRAAMATADNGHKAPLGLWWPTLPGGGPRQILMYSKAGMTPVRWFAQVSSRGTGPRLKDRILTKCIVYAGRACGARWPGPEHTPLDEAARVAKWLAEQISRTGGCQLLTYPSSAVRVCQAAKERGLDIGGARFIVGGEPYTDAKKHEIESVGAAASPIYATMETGMIGHACLSPISAGEVHLMSDSFGLIQHRRDVPHSGVSVDAFLITTLLSTAPKIMLNTENGDYGTVEFRECGCRIHALGLKTHIREIRGYDKLTAEGMTLIGTEMVSVMERILPQRYGGISTDYQVVEEEDEKGQTRMRILVSPSIGEIDENDLIETVLASLPPGGIATSLWRQAGTFTVERAQPETTGRGKLLPLHIRVRRRKEG